MDTNHRIQPIVTQRIVPRFAFMLMAVAVSVLSAFIAYGLFPLWGINSPLLQTMISSGGVGLGYYGAFWLEKRAAAV